MSPPGRNGLLEQPSATPAGRGIDIDPPFHRAIGNLKVMGIPQPAVARVDTGKIAPSIGADA
jgi:hypothetical protein